MPVTGNQSYGQVVDNGSTGGGTMDTSIDFEGEARIVLSCCVPLDIIGFFMVLFVLCLSCVRHKAKFNVGPRIFTINMMVFDGIHAMVSFINDYALMDMQFFMFLFEAGLFKITEYSDAVRSFVMLVFNCSLVPMMVMSILACYSTQRITEKGSALRFAGITGLADGLPLLIQVVNVAIAAGGTWATPLYISATFTLYAIQLTLSACALVVLHKKSTQFNKTAKKNDGNANKNLLRLIMFTSGPVLLQIPFALFLIVYKVAPSTVLGMRMANVSRLVFAMKPTVDAVFTLLFLGEYRQYTLNFYKWMREKLTGRRAGTDTTRISEFQNKPNPTRTAMPSTVSGHIGNLRDGARPSMMGRSSSLPIQITTISS